MNKQTEYTIKQVMNDLREWKSFYKSLYNIRSVEEIAQLVVDRAIYETHATLSDKEYNNLESITIKLLDLLMGL